ncbi:MAG: DUF4332 domain-containing protein [Chloroflexota bacterium]
MADRMGDLRDWWGRTRRRRLRPEVRRAVEKVRPTPTDSGSAARRSPVPVAGPIEPDAVAGVGQIEPDAVAVAGAEQVEPDAVAVAEEPVSEAEALAVAGDHGIEADAVAVAVADQVEPADEPGGADTADADPAQAARGEPWSTVPPVAPDGTSADPFAPDWIADVVEETAVDGEVIAVSEDPGADWMITDPEAAASRPGVDWPGTEAVAGVASEVADDPSAPDWGMDDGVAAIAAEPPGPTEEAAAAPEPEPWMVAPVASAETEQHVADWAPEDGGSADAGIDAPPGGLDERPALADLSVTIPELEWAAPGAAPWEIEATAGAAAERVDAPDDLPAGIPAMGEGWEADAPGSATDLPDDPGTTVLGAAGTSDAEGSAAAASGRPDTEDATSDPWAGVRWADASAPAAAPAAAAEEVHAPADDALGLDEDQRRWLGRDVELVEGIGSGYGTQLRAVGIVTLEDLLLRGATRRGRQEIVDATGISGKLVLRWVNNADLFRIRGVGTQFADLLEAAGVDTVVELALRRPDNLTARLATTNEIRHLVRQVPSEAQVTDWIRQARELPRIVAY